jgi:hypothetical protein
MQSEDWRGWATSEQLGLQLARRGNAHEVLAAHDLLEHRQRQHVRRERALRAMRGNRRDLTLNVGRDVDGSGGIAV